MAVSEREAQQRTPNGGTDDVRELQEIPTTNTRSMGETHWNEGEATQLPSEAFGSFRVANPERGSVGKTRRPWYATGEGGQTTQRGRDGMLLIRFARCGHISLRVATPNDTDGSEGGSRFLVARHPHRGT